MLHICFGNIKNTWPVLIQVPHLVKPIASVISAGQIREDAYMSDIEKATEMYKTQSGICTNQLPDVIKQ